ncbi:uncharacterized protein PpBr36_11271 [Pyricularia pennisetigena]|uniref:uncharacterized protein n=1 Tax=Pyricularia pennisetigena TaxID=1578925 RepID=UPI00114F7276|nr:uncharacterized protein PpBr36_11317 [Pyricularia pennisetigena]XP_029743297.1 uncharacterized protein PpBr36_11271 [Pyricularia pennisetigena]TLS20325.1 hypothetical protein PpBr36_11317 [Pyricularia pennisetigena]TLS20447.1 hypothetical protein PpBr36_11271 [Pyricularia pennisetigena]
MASVKDDVLIITFGTSGIKPLLFDKWMEGVALLISARDWRATGFESTRVSRGMGIWDRMTLWIAFRPGGLKANGELITVICEMLSGIGSDRE